jgi:hypothetical protein
VASQETNASGLAESTMTFGTVTEDSIQLSQFPVPPSGVPLSPCHSPSRSHFNATTPPATPTLRYGTPIRGLPLPPTTPLVLQRKPLPSGSQGQGLVSSGHDSSRVGRPANGYANSPSPPPLLSRTQDTVRTRGGSPPPPPYLTSPASRALSPHDWHEGASSIDVDATEDRLLSTSFITSLLSSTETASERSVPYSSSYRAMGSGQNRMSLSAFSGMSASSEVTYPIPTPAYQRYPPQATSTNRQPTRAESRRPPPSAYTRVEEDDWLTAASNRTSGDSVTLSPPGDIDPVIRTANISRAGVRGASIVGVVQGKLHGMTDVKPHQSLSSSNGGIARGSVDLNNNIHAEKLGVADYYVGSSSVLYSPAAPSTSTQNCFIRDNTDIRNEKHHSSRSYVPSLISAIKSLWAKPLPPVPKRFTGLESERAEAEIPLPELVNRAEILSHMLDRGYYPHRSLNSAFVTVADREVQGPELERKVTESTVVPGVMSASAGKPISHSISLWPFPRDRSPQRRGGTPLGSSVAYIPKGKTKNLSPKKKTFIVISACASIAVIVGITVGLTVKHPTTKAPVCSGNFTGSTCSLSK